MHEEVSSAGVSNNELVDSRIPHTEAQAVFCTPPQPMQTAVVDLTHI
jgi:hypothetical protein